MLNDQSDLFPPWSAEEWRNCFVVRNSAGKAIAHLYFADNEKARTAAKLLSKEQASQMAQSFTKLPWLIRRSQLELAEHE
jgi:hypothetical protein